MDSQIFNVDGSKLKRIPFTFKVFQIIVPLQLFLMMVFIPDFESFSFSLKAVSFFVLVGILEGILVFQIKMILKQMKQHQLQIAGSSITIQSRNPSTIHLPDDVKQLKLITDVNEALVGIEIKTNKGSMNLSYFQNLPEIKGHLVKLIDADRIRSGREKDGKVSFVYMILFFSVLFNLAVLYYYNIDKMVFLQVNSLIGVIIGLGIISFKPLSQRMANIRRSTEIIMGLLIFIPSIILVLSDFL